MTLNFNGLRVTSFESRQSEEIGKLISSYNGKPRLAPSLKELPLDKSNKPVLDFAKKLLNNEFDYIVLFTGVGTKLLLDIVISEYGLENVKSLFENITLICRGHKSSETLKAYGLDSHIVIPEPNTWKDIISYIDEHYDIKGSSVAVQEYGHSNNEFIKSLTEMGASVTPVTIYKIGLPSDIQPLKDAIESIISGEEDLILFTSSQQVVNLLKIAKQEEKEKLLLESIKNVLIGSIGPRTSETLESFGITADYEPDSPRMNSLIKETARISHSLLNKKRTASEIGVNTRAWKRIDMKWPVEKSDLRKQTQTESEFMKACRLKKTDYKPVWLMRQAGRFLREYRELRSKVSFLELCKTPELAAEVTLMAVDRLGVDAAIIFSDILVILEPLGVKLEFSKSDGPKIISPVRTKKSINSLRDFNNEELDFVYDAIGITRKALNPSIALIGFAGAPFTVASYMIEGGGSKHYERTKMLMYKDPGLWNELMDILTTSTYRHLNSQIDAGADAVQLFDSWAGCLSPHDYKEFVMPHMKKLFEILPSDIPQIHFGTGTSSLLELMSESGGSVIGVDWRVDIDSAWKRIGYDKAVQGNMDPLALLSTHEYIKKNVQIILDQVKGREGHIFNLGHGVLPKTPVDNVLALIDTVHELSSK